MPKLRTWATLSRALGAAGLVLMAFSFLALTDIFHGEEDARLEWGILQLAFIVIVLFVAATFILTGQLFKRFFGNGTVKIWAAISAALGGVLLVFLTVAAISLVAIRGGRPEAAPEWALLRLAYLAILVLIIAILACTALVMKYFRDRIQGEEAGKPE